MSEYQFIHFLALDRPLDDAQYAFMRRQSTRASISRMDFTNEYRFGDFHGNADEMLRRGYDVHLHYADFGIRRLTIRFPAGLPCDARIFDAYRIKHHLDWIADKHGTGGILLIEGAEDSGEWHDYLENIRAFLPGIAPIRDQLAAGDTRALYLAWLACCDDEEAPEPPVPAGLEALTPALEKMAEFYDVSDDLIAAAAEHSPPLPAPEDTNNALTGWLEKQTKDSLRKLTQLLLTGDAAAARAATLARVREETGAASWPAAESSRSLAQLIARAEGFRERRLLLERQEMEEERRLRLAAMAADPRKAIDGVMELVKERTIESYEQAASELADLREALGPERGPAEARAVAEALRSEYPRLRTLTAALRKRNLLD
jgi:hypothetical protein